MKRAIPLLLLVCCKDAPQDTRRFQATIIRPPSDTIRFTAPATVRRCDELGALLLEAASLEGNGMLVHLRFDSARDSSTYTVLSSTANATARGAAVAVRYMIRQVSHTFPLDSGIVTVRQTGRTVSAHVEGRGLDNTVLTSAVGDYHDVTFAPDKVSCRVQP